jgi:hypothetical protein
VDLRKRRIDEAEEVDGRNFERQERLDAFLHRPPILVLGSFHVVPDELPRLPALCEFVQLLWMTQLHVVEHDLFHGAVLNVEIRFFFFPWHFLAVSYKSPSGHPPVGADGEILVLAV